MTRRNPDVGREAAAADARQRILASVDDVPPGCVRSYKEVAEAAALPGRARLVARVLAELPARSPLPWHRVVLASGRIAERPGTGAAEQRARLAREGVRFDETGRVRREHRAP